MREVEDALASRDARVEEQRRALAGAHAELGARAADIAERDRRIGELEGVARYLARVVVARDRELRGLRAELADGRTLGVDLEALEARDEEGAQALARLQAQMAEIGAQARGQATRIRMQALRQAVQLASHGNGGHENGGAQTGMAEGNGRVSGANGGVGVFEGMVHMEIGPLRDFSQLVRFEDAVTGIGAASEISVKRFSRGRATLAVRLDHPVELLRELEERSPFEFRVRSLKDDRLIVDVDDA